MEAMVLKRYGSIEDDPLRLEELAKPVPSRGQVLVKVMTSGVCHTDLHVIEKELAPRKLPIVPGHQIVGVVESTGRGVRGFEKGDRVGITWINSVCGRCEFCRAGRENLCEGMHFTGYDRNGGFAEYAVASKDFVFMIPDGFDYVHAAPLFCAGIIGYRALMLSGIKRGETLAVFGFGASGHIMAQIARHWGNEFVAFTRGKEHQNLAMRLGATWAGEASETSPEKADVAIITAPAGELVIDALRNLKKGGRVVIEDIYMTPIPEIDYNRYLYHERRIGSVTNYTRRDAMEFLKLAQDAKLKTETQQFRLEEANKALRLLKEGRINGAGVLKVD